MNNLINIYELTQEFMKHKSELLQNPDGFRLILQELRKAADDSDDTGSEDDEPADDNVEKWLEEHSNKREAPQRKQHTKPWQPRGEYTPKEKAAIKQHMDNGYSHREAERMAGAHKGPSDFRSALRSGIEPSVMSDKMMGDIKPLAKLWLEEADKRDKAKADPEKNTVKRQAGKLAEAHEKNTGDFDKAYNQFLNSSEVKNLKGRDRHQAVNNWKTQWKTENPQHNAGLSDISEAQKNFAYSQPQARQTAVDRHQHILSGGQSMPTDMSAQEALQHLGGGKTEEGYQGTISHDPSATFAAQNPQLHAAMQPEQQERLKAVDSAAKAQGKIRIRKKVE